MKNYSIRFNENKKKKNIILNLYDIFTLFMEKKKTHSIIFVSLCSNVILYMLNIPPKLWILVLSTEWLLVEWAKRMAKVGNGL